MSQDLTNSQFYMWRTLFALVHVDHVVSDEEVRFMAEALEDIPFSEAQRRVMIEDIHAAQDVVEMFTHVSDTADQAKFFKFAHNLVHADGDYGPDEQRIMLRLQKVHVQTTNVDSLIGKVDLEFEDGSEDKTRDKSKLKTPFNFDAKEVAFSFREEFLKDF